MLPKNASTPDTAATVNQGREQNLLGGKTCSVAPNPAENQHQADGLDIPDFLKVKNRTAAASPCASKASGESAEKSNCRPLDELVRLIKEDLRLGDEAGLPHYRAAGQKMIEAKAQLRHGEFEQWLKRYFSISARQCRLYMRLAEAENGSALPFSSLSDFVRQTSNPNYNKRRQPARPPTKAERDADLLKRTEEREAKRKLALRVINTGYKVLAAELHPDHGGSQEAMALLNKVRDELRAAQGAWR
jgi:hypothetical protein